jgi:hypothetical protein
MLLVELDVSMWKWPLSWDIDLTDLCRHRSLGDVERQQSECIALRVGFHCPPDLMTAGTTRRERALTAKRALMALESGEDYAALAGLVTVVEQVAGHASNLPPDRCDDIGATP